MSLMCTEIEAKLKVDSLQKVAEKLKELGAEFLEEQTQIDSYFDDAEGNLQRTDRALRLRREVVGSEARIILTFKGPRHPGRFKKRQEIETEVSKGKSIERLLLALGYNRVLAYEKRRKVWLFGQCEISLDELPLLGSFVEIEAGSDARIAAVQEDLGLADVEHVQETYTSLMQRKLKELGREEKEVLF